MIGIGISPYFRKGVFTETPSSFGTLVQYIDGTISGNEFVDKSGNGYNLDIINNDLDSTLIGFPYKSTAFVAQKVANFGLIPDNNNFWFDGGGTPNQIPVHCLFQNIDYNNQTFVLHEAQVLNGAGFEASAGRVLNICTYSAALTGAKLTAANTYFGVTAKPVSNVREVGAGKTYSTIQAAHTAMTAGDTILVYSGSYNETTILTITKSATIIGVGFVKIKATGGFQDVYFQTASSSNSIKGVMFNGGTVTSRLVQFDGCSLTIDRCYFDYSKVGVYQATNATSKTATIKNCAFKMTSVATAQIGVLVAGTGFTTTIRDNKFNSVSTSLLTTSNAFILLQSQVAPIVDNNLTVDITPTQFTHINLVSASGFTTGAAQITRNVCITEAVAQYTISLGAENLHPNNFNGAIIKYNKIVGSLLNRSGTVSSCHAMLLNCGVNMEIAFNNVSYSNIGIVVKAGAEAPYVSGGAWSNQIYNCQFGIWIRGISGMNVFNNTVVYDLASPTHSAGIKADENGAAAGTQNSSNIIAKNNIVYINAGNSIEYDAYAAANGCVAEWTRFKPSTNFLKAGATTYTSIATAQGAGWLNNCDAVTTSFSAYPNIYPTAINGTDLGASYDDGFDTTTFSGSVYKMPIVVTKQQAAQWQLGAWIQ